MKRLLILTAIVLLIAASANAMINIGLHSANQGITSLDWHVVGYDIFIQESWGSNDRGFLEISGLEQMQCYTVYLDVVNNSGAGWFNFSNELLDPAGDYEDFMSDAVKQPDWIPAGYSWSNETDQLNFAQGAGIPRVSSSFSSMYVSELYGRDYLKFYGGGVSGGGGADWQSFGLRDNSNRSFLLAHTPNEPEGNVVIPEPATCWLLGFGFVGLAAFRRYMA